MMIKDESAHGILLLARSRCHSALARREKNLMSDIPGPRHSAEENGFYWGGNWENVSTQHRETNGKETQDTNITFC